MSIRPVFCQVFGIGECLTKIFLFDSEHEKGSREFLFWVAFFVRQRVKLQSAQHLIFILVQRERKKSFFFDRVIGEFFVSSLKKFC